MDQSLATDLNKAAFGPDFHWGVSTAAFQIEGAAETDGKGLSVWDVFASRKNKIKNGHRPGDACNFYHQYADDIGLMAELNIPNFRFSLSWSRLLPAGVGAVNPKGIDYYNRVIDTLLEKGITPWVTLYHWDLPHALEQRGGWTHRDIVSWFSEYTALCAQHYGDRVKHFMVMNEPSVFTGAGYFLGVHAPGRRGLSNYLKAIHHSTLATATGANILRAALPKAQIGTTFSCTHLEPYTHSPSHIRATQRVDTLLNRTFIEPLLGLGYPIADFSVLKKIEKYIQPDDYDKMAFDFDFIGIQCYTREIVKASLWTPYIGASIVKASQRKVPHTLMNWEVYPEAIYEMIKKFSAYPQIKKLIVTENGAAFPDVWQSGAVNDVKRTEYLQGYLKEVLRAKREGHKTDGYFVWTLTDNFEWAEGFHPRFGLVHVDFETQQRTVKNSGLWYRDFLK
ncbi:beta-glucosidase [Flavobacterium sp. CYK-4]|uniref:GH1 family beta-glucosidase n=1 Tax=Flavobacterium lotistagni TaxID=2709660 RepID=UPI00140C059F|nr:GH1 family beta-glucosidase [Flavobacterium lotistagni]NHM08036.1 beta-glucosidase [Flavobacterium lotistagni]